MENLRMKNQSGLLTPEKAANTTVLIVGAGAIGSFYAMTLCKMGFKNVLVYDSDTIEDHNIANQMFPEDLLHNKKVDALKIVCKEYSGADIKVIAKHWHPDNALDSDIVVMATDNMDARIAIWNHYKNKETTKLIVDGRMGAQVCRAYSVDMSKKEEKDFYESTLYPQSEAAPDRCTMKSIIFTVLGVAGFMLTMTKQWIMEEYRPTEMIFDFVNHTFFTEYKGHKQIGLELQEDEQPRDIGGALPPEGNIREDEPQGSNEAVAEKA